MRKITRSHQLLGLTLLCVILLATGCQARKGSSPDADFATYSGKSYSSSSQGKKDNLLIQEEWEDRALELVLDTAHVAKGTPYVYGGTSLSGFDCSGLVRWAYNAVGVKLPRSAREQSQYGEKIGRDDLRMGDIVAFRHPRRGYHTGIYMGNGKFIHSPRRRDVVKVSALTDAYYRDTYLGARRPGLPDSVDLQEVEKRLASVKAQKRAIETAMLSKKMRNDANPATKLKAQKSSKSKAKATSKKSGSKKKVAAKTTEPKKSVTKKSSAKPATKTKSKTSVKKAAPASASQTAAVGKSSKSTPKAQAKPASKKQTSIRQASAKQSAGKTTATRQTAARKDNSDR